MPLPPDLQVVEGAQALYDWFGYWPSFHDSEVSSLHLNRMSPSSLVVHTWEMTKDENEKGYYILTKHVLVQFILVDLLDLDLTGFSCQNVLSSLDIEKSEEGFVLSLNPCYGLSGTIQAKSVCVRLTPGEPADDVAEGPLK